jgi:DNA-binding LacI/PurR family transcriptional regulator
VGVVTLQTIADRVGVSRMSVSNAFSRPDQLSAELRDRILADAAVLGYCGPDPAGRTLSKGRSGTVGVLFTDRLSYAFTDLMATRFLAGAASALECRDIGLTVLSSPRGEGAGAVTRAVVDGLIVYSVDGDSAGLAAARRRGFPLAFADQKPEPGIACVVVDDCGGARSAAEHLVGLGHRTVAIVHVGVDPDLGIVSRAAAQPTHYVVRERLHGWLEGLGDIDPLLVNVAVNEREQGVAAGQLILAEDPRPTAVLALSDELALGVIDAAKAAGLRVPEDLSVVGYDDGPIAASAQPPLTTVRQPQYDKGRLAAEALVSALAGAMPISPAPLPTELVVRSSTTQLMIRGNHA